MSTIPTSNPVPSESPADLKFNSGKIDEFVTSSESKYRDRLGDDHYTIAGLTSAATSAGPTIAAANDALERANAARQAAEESEQHASDAKDAAESAAQDTINGINTQLSQATEARDEAVAAAEKAQAIVDSEKTFDTVAAGIAGTTSGQYFMVPSTGSGGQTLFVYYKNNSGTAVEIGSVSASDTAEYQSATSVSSSADNTINITIPGVLRDGTMIYLLSPITNTGVTTINVTDLNGNYFSRGIYKGANSPLGGGELLANQPLLIEYRAGSANNFVVVASGSPATDVKTALDSYIASNNAAVQLLNNNSLVIAKNVTNTADAYSATTDITTFGTGRVIVFTPTATNTTTNPTLALNGGSARRITSANGGAVNAGELVSGFPVLMMYEATSITWRILTMSGFRTKLLTLYGKATVTSDASSPNAISVSFPGALADGTQITFEPAATNTGPVTIAITNIAGTTATRNLVKGPNSPLSGGELLVNQPVTIQWRGAPQNNFKMLTSGDARTDIINLNAAVEKLQNEDPNGDPYSRIAKKLIGNGTSADQSPFGTITFNNGVKTVTPRRLVVTSIGSSIGTGAGSGDQAKYAPNAMFVAAISNELQNYGDIEIINDNQCIPTQALQQFSAQLDNSPYFTSSDENDWPDIVTIIGGMNDAPVGNFNAGRTFHLQKTTLEALIDKCQSKGSLVIVCTSPHHNVESENTQPSIPNGLALSWPVRTFNVTGNYTFSSEDKTITAGYFSNASYGGHIFNVGNSLRVGSGDNAGTYTIAAISSDRNTITVEESIPVSGTYNVQVMHVNLGSIAEEILYPAPSKSFATKDWSGNGVETKGDVRFEMVNNMQRTVAREKGAFIAECEIPFFEYGVEVSGWSSLFNSPNYNHPNALGYTVSYGYGLRDAARKLCRLIFEIKVFTKTEVA